MNSPANCPGIDSWQALFSGDLLPEQREHCERHLESCAVCQERLDRTNELGAEFRAVGREIGDPTLSPQDPTLSLFLGQLHDKKPSALAVAFEPDDLHFLRRTDQEGALGVLGAYEILDVIGQGGMGIVLKALEPALQRLVAIKVLSPTLAGSANARRRFTREGQAAAAVCHEHVVTVHRVAEEAGLPYLVMQYVAGESLQSRLDRTGPLSLMEVVRIAQETALGLAAAHQQGLIHRDIKPANLLLEEGTARVKITDFGLARLVEDVGLTQHGVVAGTPEYMAPEQARGEPVDHRADLFSLGSMLYTMCTGVPPFRAASSVAVLRLVSDEAPTPIRELNPEVAPWLEELIARLMAKDPDERFASADEVAVVLEGYLAHLCQPAAFPAPPLPTPLQQGNTELPMTKGGSWLPPRSWLLFLLLISALGTWLALLLVQARAIKEEEAQAQPLPPAAEVDEGIWTLAFSPDGNRLVTAGGGHELPGQLQIWDVSSAKVLSTRRAERGVRSVAYSPDGQILATGHRVSGDIKLRAPHTGEARTTLAGHTKGVNALVFSADGAMLISASLDKSVKLWDVATQKEAREFLGHTGMVFSAAFFRDAQAIVTGSYDKTARVWDLSTGNERFVLRGHSQPVESVLVSPDDKIVITGSWDGTIRLWDAATGVQSKVLRHNEGGVMSLAVSPNGDSLASGGSDGAVYLWDLASRTLKNKIRRHRAGVRGLSFSSDGRYLASGSEDRTAVISDATATNKVAILSASGAVASAIDDDQTENSLLPGSRGWLSGLTASLVILFTLALLACLVALLRRRPGKSPKNAALAAGKESSEQAAPTISFTCSGCRKNLKARPELAGKKIKCPKCGIAALVPETSAVKTHPT